MPILNCALFWSQLRRCDDKMKISSNLSHTQVSSDYTPCTYRPCILRKKTQGWLAFGPGTFDKLKMNYHNLTDITMLKPEKIVKISLTLAIAAILWAYFSRISWTRREHSIGGQLRFSISGDFCALKWSRFPLLFRFSVALDSSNFRILCVKATGAPSSTDIVWTFAGVKVYFSTRCALNNVDIIKLRVCRGILGDIFWIIKSSQQTCLPPDTQAVYYVFVVQADERARLLFDTFYVLI